MGHATQQALNTLRIEWHPTTIPTIRTVTTDGKRLTQSELTTGTWLKKPTTKGHALLSPCTAQVLHRLLHYTRPDVITVSIADALLIITLPTLPVTTRLVEGRYPNYETLTPPHLSPCLELTRKDCIESLTRLAIMAPPETPAIDLDLNANRLILHEYGHTRQPLHPHERQFHAMASHYHADPDRRASSRESGIRP